MPFYAFIILHFVCFFIYFAEIFQFFKPILGFKHLVWRRELSIFLVSDPVLVQKNRSFRSQ